MLNLHFVRIIFLLSLGTKIFIFLSKVLIMKKILPVLARLSIVACILLMSAKAWATTCPNATVISPASLPIVGH
jgi:hypothetical protein